MDYSNCQVREFVCTGWSTFIDGSCKAACDASRAALTVAEGAMEGARQSLSRVEASLGALKKAADAIGGSFDRIFNIKYAGVKFTLTIQTTKISVNFSSTIWDRDYDFQAEIDFSNINRAAEVLASVVIERLKSRFL